MSPEELEDEARSIRTRSRQLRSGCRAIGLPYVDVGDAGFEAALHQARKALLTG